MQWWNDFVEWLYSDAGWRVVSTVIVPFVAIIVAALIAAGITRGAVTRLLARQDREDRSAAVAGFIEVARQSTQWGNLPAANQDHLEALASAASIRLRLLPTHGATAAAEWAEHKIAQVRENSTSFSVQSEQDHIEMRDRLVEWQNKPKAARRLFAADLEQFATLSTSVVDEDLVEKQRQWAAEQAATEQEAAERASAEAAEQAAEEKRLDDERSAQLRAAAAEAEAAEQSAAEQSAAARAAAENFAVSSSASTAAFPTSEPAPSVPPLVEPNVAEPVTEYTSTGPITTSTDYRSNTSHEPVATPPLVETAAYPAPSGWATSDVPTTEANETIAEKDASASNETNNAPSEPDEHESTPVESEPSEEVVEATIDEEPRTASFGQSGFFTTPATDDDRPRLRED